MQSYETRQQRASLVLQQLPRRNPMQLGEAALPRSFKRFSGYPFRDPTYGDAGSLSLSTPGRPAPRLLGRARPSERARRHQRNDRCTTPPPAGASGCTPAAATAPAAAGAWAVRKRRNLSSSTKSDSRLSTHCRGGCLELYHIRRATLRARRSAGLSCWPFTEGCIPLPGRAVEHCRGT